MALDVEELAVAISRAGHSWRPRAMEPDEHHALGGVVASDEDLEITRAAGTRFLEQALDLRQRFTVETAGQAPPVTTREMDVLPAWLPNRVDWRDQGVIGPVQDQFRCGSCTSFAVTGLVGARAAIELGINDLHLSEADAHFCVPHTDTNPEYTPLCTGLDPGTVLREIQTRGVVTDALFSYMSAFHYVDTVPGHLLDSRNWEASCRAVGGHAALSYRIGAYMSLSGSTNAGRSLVPVDVRKWYLANIGPMVCSFLVYEDFDHYGGGVYRHVTGDFRGSHCVLVVGYDDNDRSWICRNSWGTKFGGDWSGWWLWRKQSSAPHADGTGAGYFKIGYGECEIDHFDFYGCHGVIVPQTSAPRVTPVRTQSQEGATSVFSTTGAGHVRTKHWPDGASSIWSAWSDVGKKTFPAHTPVTAIHLRAAERQVSLFAVGFSGYVWSTHRTGADTWAPWYRVAQPEADVASPTIKFPQGAKVTALQPRGADGSVSLYAIALDGRVWTAHFPDPSTSDGWSDWTPLVQGLMSAGQPEVLFTPGARVTALHPRSADGATSLFAVADDGRVWSTRWPSSTAPGAWTKWLPIHSHTFVPGSTVSAVHPSTDEGAVYLFAMGDDGHLWSSEWPDQKPPHYWSAWTKVGEQTFVGGNQVAMHVRSQPGAIDVFVKDTFNRIWTSSRTQSNGPWDEWTMLPFNPLFGSGALEAIHTRPAEGEVALFAADLTDTAWSIYRPDINPPHTWSNWYPV